MSFLNYFFNQGEKKTAKLAKERLQIIVAHERSQRADFLPLLQNELITVISKYVSIDREQVKVALDHSGDCSILELNISLPEVPTDIPQTSNAES